MQLPVTGPAYKHPSIDTNFQRCVNMFPITAGPMGRGKDSLIPTAGLSLIADLGINNPIRCMGTVQDKVYIVAGSTIYQLTVNPVAKTATSTSIGTITSTTGTVFMAANPTQIMWVDGSATGWIYVIATGNFSTINSHVGTFTGGVSVAYIDGYFVVGAPNTGQIFFSGQDDGISWDPADVATAESSTDNITGLNVSKGELWVFGERSTEIWYDAANPTGAPFSVRQGLQLQTGCGAPDSIVNLNDALIWLDNRGFIVQSAVSPFIRSNNSGYDLQIISDEAITAEILSYPIWNDAIGLGYNDRGHLMYQITFPTQKKTWVHDYSTKMWHERAYYDSFNNVLEHHFAQYYCQFDSINLVGGIRDGKVYISSSDYFDDAGTAIRRIRTTPVEYDPEEFRLGSIDRLDLRLKTGYAPSSGDGSDPHIAMRFSQDGGHTWSYETARSLGQIGEFAHLATWNRLGYGREWIFEFTITEPIDFAIIDAVVKIEELED